MSEISNLGYVVLGVTKMQAWSEFATQILGMQVAEYEAGKHLSLRMDEHAQRLLILPGDDDMQAIGWQFSDCAELHEFVDHVRAQGVAVQEGDAALAASRKVRQLFVCQDPAGFEHEFYFGPTIAAANQPFRSSALKGPGFQTGALGLGHVLTRALGYPEAVDFYQRVLKLRISDYIREEIAPGIVVDATFMHTKTGRHHSLATAVMPTPKKLSHMMVEVQDMDDVGLAYDRSIKAGHPIRLTLGHHPNDKMFSFYVESPSGFSVEFGWGGVVIDESQWQVITYTKLSDWGHHRQLPPAKS